MTNRILRLLLFPLLLVIALSAEQSRAQNCFKLKDSIFTLGDILANGQIDTTIAVIEFQFDELGIIVEYEKGDLFSPNHIRLTNHVEDTVKIPKGTVGYFTFKIDSFPPTLQTYTVSFRDVNTGCVSTAQFRFRGIDTTPVEAFLPITPGVTQTYAFHTEDADNFKMLRLRNTLQTPIEIKDIIAEDTSVIRNIKSPQLLPTTLNPQDTFTFTFQFIADSVGYHRSGVRVPTDIEIASEYSIQVIRFEKGVGSVAPIVSKSGIRISQSTGEIAIEGLPFDRGELAIYDLLGRRVRRHEINSSEFLLQKQDDSGQPLPDGGYIVSIRDKSGRIHENVKVLMLSY